MDDDLPDCREWLKLYYDIDYILSSGKIYIKDKLTYDKWEKMFTDMRDKEVLDYEIIRYD